MNAETQMELLSPEQHRRLRVRAAAPVLAHFAQVFTGEFAAAAAWCPLLFTKDPASGNFYAGAIFGTKPGENLVGEEPGSFVPLMWQRDGFFLAGRNVAIDRRHPRFSETDGAPLFEDADEPGAELRRVQRVLGEIHVGIEQTNAFIAELTGLKLLEPIDISLAFKDGERLTLQGLYTVSLDRLRDLEDAEVIRLFRAGHLQLAYTMIGSLRQIGRLAQRRDLSGISLRSTGAG